MDTPASRREREVFTTQEVSSHTGEQSRSDEALSHVHTDIQALCASTARHELLSTDPAKREKRWRTLLATQREIEEEGMARGSERFRRRVAQAEAAGKASTVGAAKRLLTHAIEPTEKAIQFFLDEQKSKRGVKHCAVKWIEEVGADVSAYMAVRVILDRIGQRPALREVGNAITDMMLDELRYRRFETLAPGLFNYRMSRFTTSSYVHMARTLNATMRNARCVACSKAGKQFPNGPCPHLSTVDLKLAPTQHLLVGAKLVDLVMQATGLISFEHEKRVVSRGKKGVRTDIILSPTPETQEFITKRNEILEFLSPVAMPMVVPPLQWEPHQRGGYRYALRNKYALVRMSFNRHGAEQGEMPLVYGALNAIQNTPWRIHGPVLDLLKVLVERRLDVKGIPSMVLEEEPPKPHDIATNYEARKDWRKRAHAVKERNHEQKSLMLEVSRVLEIAERMRGFDAIFFPHNLDFRGRIYPICHYLTPQGNDIQKALLLFAQGKPLGDHGASYLALHGCNVLDTIPADMNGGTARKVKMMTLDERIDWIVEHSADICAVAHDPLGYRWWMEAEEPLQFYAFCLEWKGFMDLAREGRGAEYVCALPVAIDGSCNGLQHFSAMFKDPIGARAVNVSPTQEPQDVYHHVAEKVKDALEQSEHEHALMWLGSGLVDRKLTKRPTMTFSYGSKQYGFQQQIQEYLKEPERWADVKPRFVYDVDGKEKNILPPACTLMAELIWNALRETVVAAFHGMEWLQQCASVVAKGGKPIEWTVPLTGFRVRQMYAKQQFQQIKTVLAGRIVKPSVSALLKKMDTRKQANAISPNVIHSLDAAALMLSVTQCQTEGVEHFAAIHDSYGTLPADMPILWRAARQAFVHLYANHDVIGDLSEQFQAQAPEGEVIPQAPPEGSLDVSSVLVSDYFFC